MWDFSLPFNLLANSITTRLGLLRHIKDFMALGRVVLLGTTGDAFRARALNVKMVHKLSFKHIFFIGVWLSCPYLSDAHQGKLGKSIF